MNPLYIILGSFLIIALALIGSYYSAIRLNEIMKTRKGYIYAEIVTNTGRRFKKMVKPKSNLFIIKIDGEKHKFQYKNNIGSLFRNESGILTAVYDNDRKQIDFTDSLKPGSFDTEFIDNVTEMALHHGMVSATRRNKYDDILKYITLAGVVLSLALIIFTFTQTNEIINLLNVI